MSRTFKNRPSRPQRMTNRLDATYHITGHHHCQFGYPTLFRASMPCGEHRSWRVPSPITPQVVESSRTTAYAWAFDRMCFCPRCRMIREGEVLEELGYWFKRLDQEDRRWMAVSPQGAVYEVDAEQGTCGCRAYHFHGHCKHLLYASAVALTNSAQPQDAVGIPPVQPLQAVL